MNDLFLEISSIEIVDPKQTDFNKWVKKEISKKNLAKFSALRKSLDWEMLEDKLSELDAVKEIKEKKNIVVFPVLFKELIIESGFERLLPEFPKRLMKKMLALIYKYYLKESEKTEEKEILFFKAVFKKHEEEHVEYGICFLLEDTSESE